MIKLKFLANKIKANNAQYKIDRLNAEISAFSEGDLDKYEFLTRKDLKYKPNAFDKAKFEFSPLGKAFNQGLDKKAESYKEEGVIKLLKDIIEVDVKCPRKLHDLHSDLPFLPKRMKIDKCKKLVCNLRNKKKYVVHIRSLKQALNHGLKLKKVHRIIEFNQEKWLKPYIDMNTELRKIAKNDFEKDFFKLMNNAVFGKTMENVKKTQRY